MKLPFAPRVNSTQIKGIHSGSLVRYDGLTYHPAHRIPALDLPHTTLHLCKQVTPYSIYMMSQISSQAL